MNVFSQSCREDDVKTAAEHEKIILRYQTTGVLNRDDAIKKYKDFNTMHPEYYASMMTAVTISGTGAEIGNVPDGIIVENLRKQLLYLAGKNIVEDKSNG